MGTTVRYTPIDAGPFADVHERFVHAGLEVDWDTLAQAPHSRAERERGRRSFVMRALDEQRSLLAFSELLSKLCESGAPIDVIGACTRVVRDEALHVDLCRRMVEALGGWPSDAAEPRWVRSDPRRPLRERILRTVIGSLCVGETISVAMLASVRAHASDDTTQHVLTRMLADESFHSRFGWWWLENFGAEITPSEQQMLERWLPKVLGGVEQMMLPQSAASGATAEGKAPAYVHSPFGSASPEERSAALGRVLHETILPGLERAGIAATRAWDARGGNTANA